MRYTTALLGLAATALTTPALANDVSVVIRPGTVVKTGVDGPAGPIFAYNVIAPANTGKGEVTTTAPRNGNGSLEITGDRARYVIGNEFGGDALKPGTASQTLGNMSTLNRLTFDWMVGVNGTGQLHAAPAVRAHIIDNINGTTVRSELIWEYVYNGGTQGQLAPTGAWTNAGENSLFYLNVRSNAGTFANATGLSVLGSGVVANGTSQINQTIADWQSVFTSNAYITGFSFGAGSGFGAPFQGFVDNVQIGVNGGNFNVNFEAVPEPATWAMMIGGFGMIGGVMRRRARVNVAFA